MTTVASSNDACYVRFESEKWDAETKARIVIDVIKLILYQRHQIPCPIELISREKTSLTQKLKTERTSSSSHQLARVCLNLLALLDEISAHFIQLFNVVTVHQVMLLLGPTSFSPKYVYIINFDTSRDQIIINLPFPKPEAISRKLMQELATNDYLINSRSTAITNLSVFVKLPRCSSTEWFIPRQDFKLRSQITPFVIDIFIHPQLRDVRLSDTSSNINNNDHEDFLWFETPVRIKGYKDKL